MSVNFPPQLADWICHNLDRGCAPVDLIRGMQQEGFAPEVASGLVQAFVDARTNGAPLPRDSVIIDDRGEGYLYETPRLPAGPILRTHDRDVPVAMRLERPVAAVLDDVLSIDECERLIALARPRLQPSTIVDPETGEDRTAEHRDSEGMFFHLNETPFIANLDRRISALMNCPVENGEGLQVLRYGPRAKNTPHFDFLIPSNPANKASLARSGQRISTMVIYLNQVERGGETVFPEVGLAVLPRQGSAVYFEYGNSRRQVDPLSVHAGAPVIAGEKWAMTKWMRERPFVAG